MDSTTEPRFLVVGEVLKPHGVRGEVRVRPHTDLPERFGWLASVLIGPDPMRIMAVEGVRFHQELILLKLSGIDDRESAARLRGRLLHVPIEEAITLNEDEYFLFQLEGLAVYSDTGRHLGAISSVIETGANHVFVVRGEEGEILLPDTAEVIQDIDFERQRMTVHLLPGLGGT